MRIEGIIWLDSIVEKLEHKHDVAVREVEEVLSGKPRVRYVESGFRKGEDVYVAAGRTRGGRRLVVFFVYKPRSHEVLILSARPPSRRERNL